MEKDEKLKMELFRGLLKKFAGKSHKIYAEDIAVPELLKGFGRLRFDKEKCWGCAACKVQCLEDALKVVEEGNKRIIQLDYWKCIACEECVKSCPKEAVKLEKTFSLKAFLSDKPIQCIEVELSICSRCGGVIMPLPELKEVREKVSALNVPPHYFENISKLCEKCRRELTATALIESRG